MHECIRFMLWGGAAGGAPGTVLMSRPGTAMRETEPWHDEPARVTLHSTPKPAEWRKNAAFMSCAVSSGVTEAEENGAVARSNDSASLPAT